MLLYVVCQKRQPFGNQMFSSLAVSVSPRRPPPARCEPIVNSSELKLKGDTSGVTLCYLKLLLVCIYFIFQIFFTVIQLKYIL